MAYESYNEMGFSGNQVSRELKKKQKSSNSAVNSEIIDSNQDQKRRCYEKSVVNNDRIVEETVEKDVKCALIIQVVDDTALIEATAAVSGFKNCYGNENDAGGHCSKGLKKEIDGKKRKNKCKKREKWSAKCSTKCVNDKKMLDTQWVKDQNTPPKGKSQNVFRVKLVNQKKDTKVVKSIATSVEEQKAKKESTTQMVEKMGDGAFGNMETERLKETNDEEKQKQLSTQLIESQTVCEKKDDGLSPKNKTEDQRRMKMAYTREEMEALKFVGEDEQKKKWTEVYCGLKPAVCREYNGLLLDSKNRQSPKYDHVAHPRHAILGMPPVLPLSSSSKCRKFAPYGDFGFKVNSH